MKGEEEVLAQVPIEDISRNSQGVRLRIIAEKQDLRFSFSYDGKSYHIVKAGVDARILSTDVAGGFVGNTMGLYCSSNGKESTNHADYDWLYYKNM